MKSFGWLIFFLTAIVSSGVGQNTLVFERAAKEVIRRQVINGAKEALRQEPITVTASFCERSAGGRHDFYSEGDYWWPDSSNLSGPYIQRDGVTNPENFTAHRKAMIRFSGIVAVLTSAYLLEKNDLYARHAIKHLKAWFVDEKTRMNPHLLYAQAIKGRVTGRGIGIIDTIHLLEVVQSAMMLEKHFPECVNDMAMVKKWFVEYLTWLTTHSYGQDEMNAKNNHGTCWVMQVAQFAKFTNNRTLMDFCRKRFKEVLLPGQMSLEGSFPLELKRTKPYGYSIFNLDAMVMTCVILSSSNNNLWKYKLADGRSIEKGISFLFPFLEQKEAWPFQRDVMYWDEWPIAQPSLIFGAIAFQRKEWFQLWSRLEHNPQVEEVIRNTPVRNPIIWLDEYIRVN